MKTLLITLSIVLIISKVSVAFDSVIPPERFSYAIEELRKFLIKEGIQLQQGEQIKDVATLGYLNSLNLLDATFGDLDKDIKLKTKDWLSIWCWFPGIPESKKKKAKNKLIRIRQSLCNGSYKRTIARLTVVQDLVVTSLGEISSIIDEEGIIIPQQEISAFFWSVGMAPKETIPLDIENKILKGKFNYEDLINFDWVEKYIE